MSRHLPTIRKLLIFIFVFSCIVAWKAYLVDLNNPYVVGDDARSVLVGVLRFSDPNLFPNYFLADYAEHFVNPGVRFLYFLSSGFVDPIAFSKIISFFILVTSTIFLFKLIHEITSSMVSSTLASLFFASISTFKISIVGGFPRSFTLLLTILFLYFLIKRYWIKVFAVLASAILIHPISFLVCYGTFVLSSFSFKKGSISIDKDRKRTISLIVSLAFATLILVPQNILNNSSNIGKTMGPAIAKTEAAYYEGGRPGNVSLPTQNVLQASYHQLIGPFTLNSKAKTLDGSGFSKEKSIVTRLLFGLTLLWLYIAIKKGLKIVPKEITCYLLSGLICYSLADIFFIKLYFPDRYIANFGLISLIIVFSSLNFLLQSLDLFLVKKIWFTLIVFFASLGIFLASDFTSSIGMNNYFYDKPILEYISKLPNDTVVAAFPAGTADSIPLLARRKSFIFQELSNPLYDQHWKWVKGKTMELFHAYYSDDLKEVEHFMESNGINYFLVDSRHFKKDFLSRDKIYFNPFSEQILEIIRGKKNFALQRIVPSNQDFRLREKYIVSLKKIRELNSTTSK